MRLDDDYRSHVDDLSRLFLRTPGGGMVPLDTIAHVERGSGPVVINRKYLQRIIDVTANVAPGKDLGGASAAVQHVLDELPPPDGFTVRLGGQTEAQTAGVRRPDRSRRCWRSCSSTWCWRRSSSR